MGALLALVELVDEPGGGGHAFDEGAVFPRGVAEVG